MKQKKPLAIIEQDNEKRKKKILSLVKKQKGQVLILVPEVAMLEGYADMGTIYHAGLKQSEKKAIWSNVQKEEIQTIIGTQKALFLPFQDLKTIVIDEEQYESYKLWDQYPRLNTVRAAGALGSIFSARILYASSYPSIRLRYMIEQKECEVESDNPVAIQAGIIPFGFEDRKWKRALPNEAGTQVRAWARGGKKVLVLYNKKDNQKIKDVLYFRLSKKAKENISLGTASLLTDAMHTKYDRVVWITPEFTMKAIDYRSAERARILAARLQSISPKYPITIVTRSSELATQAFTGPDSTWYERTVKERRLLNLPPFTDLVRLTIRDKDTKKAKARAESVFEMLEAVLKDAPKTNAFGPFQEKGPKKSKLVEFHILVSGEFDTVVSAYQNLPIDSADVDPHRIV
jgi:primosomal protein N'